MKELLLLSIIFLASGIIASLLVFVVMLFEDGPWDEENTQAVLVPILVASAMSISICTFGIPVLLTILYKAPQKIKHPDSRI